LRNAKTASFIGWDVHASFIKSTRTQYAVQDAEFNSCGTCGGLSR
jgi:hypothetical protein